jgi:hypothetical protein
MYSLNHERACTLKLYLEVRPTAKVNLYSSLILTDEWDGPALIKCFKDIGREAEVDKPGGPHVFSRIPGYFDDSRGFP